MSQPTATGQVTCDFGVPGSWAAGYHTGRDYRAAVGTPIRATRGGRVIAVSWTAWGEAYGLHVVISSRGSRGRIVRTGYCHLTRADVQLGQHVGAGQLVGLSGQTGRTFGAHLHLEERLDPWRYNDQVRNPRFPGRLGSVARRLRRRRLADHPNAKES